MITRREFSESQLIFDSLKREAIGMMVDVGAHFGESFGPYQSLGWKIIAFEPDPKNRSVILQNPTPKNVILYECAVGNVDEQAKPFYASEESTGVSGLSAFLPTHQKVCDVEIRTLKSIVEENRIECIDYLKIDTEGYDKQVLEGVPWEILRPRVIMCEYEDVKTRPLGYTHKELGNFLLDHGYSVWISEWFPIIKYGGKHKWRSVRLFPAELQDKLSWGNFIAISNENPVSILKSKLMALENR